MHYLLLLVFIILQHPGMLAQTGPGIGIYPTGTETGLGYRSAKDTRWAADVRITRANVLNDATTGTLVNEVSVIYRILYLEKVRFHIGLGGRGDWNFDAKEQHKFGVVVPIGIEAFPFPFQNAGLFFEAAPFYTVSEQSVWNSGIRTVAGFIFYIPQQ